MLKKTKMILLGLFFLGLLILVFTLNVSASIHVDETKELIYIYDDEHDMQEIMADASVTTAMLENLSGGNWLLNFSIQVNDTGSLVLTPDDHCVWLKMHDQDGTQLSNITVHGKFYANNTMITSWNRTAGENSTGWDVYRPYIYIAPLTDADDTHAEFNTCQIGYLGFNEDNKYGIVYEDTEGLDPTGHMYDCTVEKNHIGIDFQGCSYMWVNDTNFNGSYYVGMVWTTSDDGSGEGSDQGGANEVNITNTGGTTFADGMRTLSSDHLTFKNMTIDTVTNGGDGWHMDTAGDQHTAHFIDISNCAGWGMNVHNPGAGFTNGDYKWVTITDCTLGGVNFSTSNTNSFYDFTITNCNYGFQFVECHNDTFDTGVISRDSALSDPYGFHFKYEKDTSISNYNITRTNYSIYIDESGTDDSHDMDIDNTTFYQIGYSGTYIDADCHHINFYDMTVFMEDPDVGVWACAYDIGGSVHNITYMRGTIEEVGGGWDTSGTDEYIQGYTLTDVGYAGWMIDGADTTVDDCVLGGDDAGWGVYFNSDNTDCTFDNCVIKAYEEAVFSMGNNSQGVFNNTWLSSVRDHVVNAEENSTLYFYNCTGLWDNGDETDEYSFHLENATDVTITGFYGMDVETNITTSGYNYHKAQGNYVKDLFTNFDMYNMTITPASSYVLAEVTAFSTSGVTWTLNAVSSINVAHVVNDLTANTNYYPFRDSIRYGSRVTSNAGGTATYTYSGGFSEHNLALQTYSSTYSATTENLLDNVIPILVAVAGIIMIIGLLFTAGVSYESLLAVLVIAILMIVTLELVYAV